MCMSDSSLEKSQLAETALSDETALVSLVENLSSSSRMTRQSSASALSLVADKDASLLSSHISAFVDALNRPEAQTRWEVLDILTKLVAFDSRSCATAINGAEAALFDEGSGPLRLAALRFLCKVGGTTELRSQKVWPLVDEAIQCYHGDVEFLSMLNGVIEFAGGTLADNVRGELKERMSFDASNSKGLLQRRAQEILDALG